MRDHLFCTEKIKYIMGEKPDVDCILCAIRDQDEKVKNLEVIRTENHIISLNMYPYNPGHLMIFPLRHITALNEFTDVESLEMHKLLTRSIEILKDEFNPAGFNVGYNIGDGSGASITHIHQHIVPRYSNEVGFMDVMAGTRVVVIEPALVLKKLKKKFEKYY